MIDDIAQGILCWRYPNLTISNNNNNLLIRLLDTFINIIQTLFYNIDEEDLGL